MSKERLESLKRNREWTEATGGKFYTVDSDDYKWLIKQAERTHELEQQNKRYKQALEFYADKETYETKFATVTDEIFDPFTLIKLDEGKKYTNAQIAKVVKYIVENVEMLNNALDDALRVTEIEQQNKRYRKALKFYAKESNYDYDVKVDSISYVGDQSEMKFYRLDSEILYDRGKKARQALEGEK